MATNEELNEEQRLLRFNIRQRRALDDALGALLGQQASKTFQAFTFEDAVDLQIENIEGTGTARRPNRLDRVDSIEEELLSAVDQLKKVPLEQFLEADPDRDVNT